MLKAHNALLGSQKQGPIIKMVQPQNDRTHSAGGCSICCCCRCFTCIHIEFFRSGPGMMKLFEVFISGMIHHLLLIYGIQHKDNLGPAFESTLTTSTGCFINSTILLICYTLSEKSYKQIRSSLFETIFNTLACVLYACSIGKLGYSYLTSFFTSPVTTVYEMTTGYTIEMHHTMKLSYSMCSLASLVYGVDAYSSYQEWKKS